MKLENITVFTDASLCHQTAAAGGAYWARTQDQFSKHSWPMRHCTAAHVAEIQAAATAVHTILCSQDTITLPPRFRLVLVTDCETVKRCLETGAGCGELDSELWRLVHAIPDLLATYGGTLKVNHVKAHTGRQDARSYVNRWCDREAKKRMREQRKAIIEQRSIQECKSIVED